MRVKVLFFGVLKDLVGKAEESVDLPAGYHAGRPFFTLFSTLRNPEHQASVDSICKESGIR